MIKQSILKVNQNINSISHKHKETYSVVVKEFEIITPDIKEIDSIFDTCDRDCYQKIFHTFKIECMYVTEMSNDGLINGKISGKKLKIARQKGFRFDQINKIPIKRYTNLSNLKKGII